MISLSRSRASTSSRRSAGILLLVFVFARCGEDAPSQPEGPPPPDAPFQLWVLPGFGTSPTARYRAYPYDIDPTGHVVGMAESSENSGLFGAALWLAPDGRLASLNADGIVLQVAYGINAIGQVVGVGGCGEMGTACMWENGRLRDMGSLDYDGRSEPLAINDNGDVVGWAQAGPHGSDHAVLWRDGVATDLGTLGGLQSQALDIDNSGRVVGWARTERPDGSPRRAFLWQDGTMMDLGPPGPAESFAFAINDRGQVVGHFAGRASLWENGVMTLLPGTENSQALDINERGDIVGTYILSNAAGTAFHAALWRDGVRYDLNDIAGHPAVCLNWAYAINDAGMIVGVGAWKYDAREFGFLITPTGSGEPQLDARVRPIESMSVNR